jgi:hypothetical protein
VYQNGVKLVNGDDYTAADGATVTLTTGAATGDSIVIVASFPRGLSDGYLKSEADAKYAPIAAPTFTGVATFSKGSSSGVTIGDVTTNSNSVLRMQGTSAGKNWQIANNLNVAGIEFTPSTADGGTTYTTPTVTFLSSGSVGIGTSSPTAKLQVYATTGEYIRAGGKSSAAVSSDITISRTSSTTGIVQAPNLYFDDGTTNNTRAIQCGQGNQQFWAYRNGWIEDMRIDSSGNLLVGTTSSTAKLTVSSAANANGVAYLASSSVSDLSNPALILSKYDNNSTTSQVLVRFIIANGNTAQGQINANGAASAAFGAWSDQRLKENIIDLPPQLDNIMALRPVEFDYIESEGGGHQIGFIAQEVQNIYPDLVGERQDGMLTLTDLNKNDARLIKAIQEQQAIIEQLQADVATLKGTP